MKIKLLLSAILVLFVIWIAIPKAEYPIADCKCDLVTDKFVVVDTVYQLKPGQCKELYKQIDSATIKGFNPTHYVILYSNELYVSIK